LTFTTQDFIGEAQRKIVTAVSRGVARKS